MTLMLALALAGGAVLVWPAAPGRAGRSTSTTGLADGAGGRGGEGALARVPEAGATVEDLADAVVLLALLLRGGLPLATAMEQVAAVSPGQVRLDLLTIVAGERWGLPDGVVWDVLDPAWRPVGLALQAAREAGVPPAGLLVAVAHRMSQAGAETAAARVERSAALLAVPLGLLFLPGFLATTVVPIARHLLAAWH